LLHIPVSIAYGLLATDSDPIFAP